ARGILLSSLAIVSFGAWAALSLLDLSAGLLVAGSVAHQQALPLAARTGAWFTSSALMLLALLMVGLLIAAIRLVGHLARVTSSELWNHSLAKVRQRPSLVRSLRVAFPEDGLVEIIGKTLARPPRWLAARLSPMPAWLSATLACIAAIGVVTMHGSGWLVMQQMGAFSGLEGLRFWWLSPGQAAQHVADFSPMLFLGAPLFALLYGAMLALLVPRLLASKEPRTLWLAA